MERSDAQIPVRDLHDESSDLLELATRLLIQSNELLIASAHQLALSRRATPRSNVARHIDARPGAVLASVEPLIQKPRRRASSPWRVNALIRSA